jgi:hypothetical protein
MLLMLAAQPVECVKGCGGDSTVTAIGLIVAFLSLAVAVSAWRLSNKSLGIATTEHRVFMERLNARADFELNCYVVSPPLNDGVYETTASVFAIKWQMGITNSGEKAANDVGVNFLIPHERTVPKSFGWVTQANQRIGDAGRVMTTAEELVATDGSRHPAHYLILEIPRQTRRTAGVIFATADLKSPPPGEEIAIPYKFKVWSDDLPDDVEARTVEGEIRVRRVL